MIQMIKNHKKLKPYICSEIEDAGMHIDIAGDLGENDYAAIKVDDYYMGQHDATPPKAVDFLTTVDCTCNSYALYILELKNIHSPKNLSMSAVREKFTTTIERFMMEEYRDIFLNDKFKYKLIKLYLVSSLYNAAGQYKNYEEYRKRLEKAGRRDTLRVDRLMIEKPFRFRNWVLRIEHEIPPNPVIRRIL